MLVFIVLLIEANRSPFDSSVVSSPSKYATNTSTRILGASSRGNPPRPVSGISVSCLVILCCRFLFFFLPFLPFLPLFKTTFLSLLIRAWIFVGNFHSESSSATCECFDEFHRSECKLNSYSKSTCQCVFGEEHVSRWVFLSVSVSPSLCLCLTYPCRFSIEMRCLIVRWFVVDFSVHISILCHLSFADIFSTHSTICFYSSILLIWIVFLECLLFL